MSRLADLLKIHPGEGRKASLLIGLMLCTMAGSALGGTGVEALFFARFGVEYLPYLYMGLGVTTLITTLTITALLGRIPREVLYISLALILGLVLVGGRGLLALGDSQKWIYPVLWLGKEVLNTLIGLLSWGLAGTVCDTRQAKRLFPLFGAGRILGSVLGGLGTGPMVAWLGTENLLLVWAASMGLAFILGRMLVSNIPTQAPSRVVRKGKPSNAFQDFVNETQQGYQFVRRSPLMRWISVAAVLFSILYFSIALPFSKAATTQFPTEAELAGFLGLFNGLHTAVAFLASLFLANRLYARFGVVNMVLALPLIYVAGFGALIVATLFPVIVSFRFAQMVWLAGIADAAYQVIFNLIPATRRDQVRAFIGGVPEQAGIVIAGLILVIGEQALQPDQLYFIGLVAAALTVFVFWRIRRAYAGALVDALRAGQPQVFFSTEEPFGGFRRDAAAVTVAVNGLTNADPIVRRVSAEVLGNLPVPDATQALVNALRDNDSTVRAAALRGLASAQAASALLDVVVCLSDAEPEVRTEAVRALRDLAGYPHGLMASVRPLLNDPDSLVATNAAVALLRLGPDSPARDFLRSLAVTGEIGERLNALQALGEWGDAEAFELVCVELEDNAAPAAVRRTAATTLARIDARRACEPLVQALADEDDLVREAVAQSLGQVGASALMPVVGALSNPAQESGALLTLEHLPIAMSQAAAELRAYAQRALADALHYHDLTRGFEVQTTDDRLDLLADALHDKAHTHAYHAMRAVGLIQPSARATIALAIDNLKAHDPGGRANALESLEAVGEAALMRPLLKLWETTAAKSSAESVTTRLSKLLREPDAWVRVCAVFAAQPAAHPSLRDTVTALAHSDPEAWVRATATAVLKQGSSSMDTLATLSPMERILFLRRVPLFAGLSPSDLKRVAGIINEQVFPDGDFLSHQGETGDEMFIIVAGEVRVVVAKGGQPEKDVARRQPGEVVGEMAIISREPRMASLVAVGEVRVLGLDQKTFEGLVRERPEISLAVMRVLCVRLKEATG